MAMPTGGTADRLFRVSEIELGDYGYHLAYPNGALGNPGLKAFRDWIIMEANEMFESSPVDGIGLGNN